MAHLQYMPGDPRLVDQLVYELKSKGIFDQFRKDCIADVDTRPAYQNLRQRVENSVSTFLSRQTWQPDLNKNQLREKLRKHILDGNYLEQGVERIVDQVVNPKVASVFIPKVEDLVYNYLGITRKKSVTAETSNGKVDDLLPTDLEAVSPGSVKSNNDIDEEMETDNVQEQSKMEVDDESKSQIVGEISVEKQEEKTEDTNLLNSESNSNDKCNIPLPAEEINPENIPPPENSPPKLELETIELPKDPIISTDIPLPDDISKDEKDKFFKPVNSDEEESSSDSSLRRNMSPLTPIRNFNNENSYDAQQAFENDTTVKDNDIKEPSSFRFAIEAKSPENIKSPEVAKNENKDTEVNLSYQFNNQVNINNYNTPTYEDSSNSNNLQIDYESDANSKVNIENKVPEIDQYSEDSKKDKKSDEKKSSHKSSHRSRDSHRNSSSKDKRSDSKHSSTRDSKHDKSKSSRDESKPKSSDKEKSRDKKDEKRESDSSRNRSSHKSSHKDSKSHRSSSSSHRHSSKHSDDKKSSSSSSQKEKDKSDKSVDKPKDSRSSSHRSDKDRKNNSSSSSKNDKHKHKHDDKQKDKKKKETDDHYSVSGRNNPNRRSTDRDSNDGSSSSKGSHHPSSSKSSQSKKESKSSSKSESTSTSSDSTSPSDKENIIHDHSERVGEIQNKPIIRVESHLELPVTSPPRLPFVPDVTIKKPKFAANLEEAKRLMKMRKFLDEEQKRMNQEAALLLEFQANVRPSLSQVYSNIPGPELEFACISNMGQNQEMVVQSNDNMQPHYTNNQLLNVLNDATIEVEKHHAQANKILNHIEETNKVDDICNYNKNTSETEIKEVDNTLIDMSNDRNTVEQATLGENKSKTEFEITKVNEEDSESEVVMDISKSVDGNKEERSILDESHINGEIKLQYFAEHEKYSAEIERAKFSNFLKEYSRISNKIYLINCNTYEEKLIRDESKKLGEFEIISYQKNGHLLPKIKNVIKDVNISTEISLPYNEYETFTLSPDKSECFELGSDYDAKLEEMVNKASRQEIMEIILGNVSASPSKMPRIDYVTDSKIDNDYDNDLKRKLDDSIANNNRPVLTPNKIRRLSGDQITSTTQEDEERPNNKLPNITRSKYLGKARRVGLPRPKRTILPHSPSSDKSVENYEQAPSPNGKIKRSQVQRYDTSDLYKPKLHYLSRRNHFT